MYDEAHNILKPVLSSEESSLDKEYETQIGIIITATKELKKSGNFDSTTGTFDDFIEYFHPYSFESCRHTSLSFHRIHAIR